MRLQRRRRLLVAVPIALAALVLGLSGAAGGIPRVLFSTPPTPPPTTTGLPQFTTSPVNKAYAKVAGQVAAPKVLTTINQPIQITYAPNAFRTYSLNGKLVNVTSAYIFPISEPGSSDPYGDFYPITVKTLAFGAIPTTLTLNVRSHFEDGLPTWAYFEQSVIFQSDGTQTSVKDPALNGQLDVSISDVAIDGVPLDVGDCHTSAPADFQAHAKLYKFPFQRPPPPVGDEEPLFTVFGGGELKGTINVPSFTGCQNGSEDLDRLFTTLVSGDDNPLLLTSTGSGSYENCVNSGNTGPACGPLTPLPLPTNSVHQH